MTTRRKSILSDKRISNAFWITLATFMAWWFISGQSSRDITAYKYQAPPNADWITTYDSTQYTACLRKDINLLYDVRQAHISVTSTGGYELLVNGNPVGAQMLWRPTRHFQNGLSTSGQRYSAIEPIITYNFPREYQWTGHNNQKMVTHFDLTPYLKKGRNSISIEVEGRRPNPAAIAFGSILLKNGKRISIQSDNTWVGEPVPKGLRQPEWIIPSKSVKDWKKAIPLKEKRRSSFLSPVPPTLYSQYQRAHWTLGKKVKGQDGQTFCAQFSLNDLDDPTPSYLKVLTHGNHWIWVNGKRLQGNRGKRKGFNGGEWMVNWEGRRPLAVRPTLLDSDETADFFGGYRYLTPSHGDPTENTFRRFKNTINKVKNRPNATGSDLLDDERDPEEPKSTQFDPYGYYEEPNVAVPHAVLRKLTATQYHAYDIHSLLKKGENTLKIRLVDNNTGRTDTYAGSQAHRFMMAGTVSGTPLENLEWFNEDTSQPAIKGKEVTPEEVPRLIFQGSVGDKLPRVLVACFPVAFFVLLVFGRRLEPLRKHTKGKSGI